MKRLTLVFTILVATALATHGAAQEHAMAAQPAPEPLEAGLGTLHHKVSTSNAEAQRYFDQGMRYVFAFNHDASVRSFTRATELDPDLAMAYWGIALSLGPNINMDVDPDRELQAFKTVHTAMEHLSKASEEERDLVNTLRSRLADTRSLASQDNRK